MWEISWSVPIDCTTFSRSTSTTISALLASTVTPACLSSSHRQAIAAALASPVIGDERKAAIRRNADLVGALARRKRCDHLTLLQIDQRHRGFRLVGDCERGSMWRAGNKKQ
jgi:hypothetical protein